MCHRSWPQTGMKRDAQAGATPAAGSGETVFQDACREPCTTAAGGGRPVRPGPGGTLGTRCCSLPEAGDDMALPPESSVWACRSLTHGSCPGVAGSAMGTCGPMGSSTGWVMSRHCLLSLWRLQTPGDPAGKDKLLPRGCSQARSGQARKQTALTQPPGAAPRRGEEARQPGPQVLVQPREFCSRITTQ